MRKYLLGAVSFAVLGSSLFAQYTNTNIQPTTSVVPGAPLQAPATLGPVMTSAPYGPAVHQMGQVGQATAGCSSGSCGHGGCCGRQRGRFRSASCLVPECGSTQ